MIFSFPAQNTKNSAGRFFIYDVIIIGMGPAGMTAAVYAARKKMKTLLVGKEYGGQVARTGEVENYMGFQYVSGPELMKKFEEQVEQYPVGRGQSGAGGF